MWQLYNEAVAVLGTRKKAISWIFSPNRAMGGQRPIQNPKQGLEILGRIEWGIFS